MIVRQFLHWLRTAPPGERAEATSALARAYLYSDLSDSDRAAAEGAMIMLLDDPSPLVRQALAAVFAASRGGAADHRPCAGQRSARCGVAVAGAFAALPRHRSGRCGRHRRSGAAGCGRRPSRIAAVGVGGDRRGRLCRILPRGAGKSGRRVGAVLARPHRRAARASRGHSRRSAGARRPRRRRPDRRWLPSCRRRLPISSPRANGSPAIAPRRSPRKPARRPPSLSLPTPTAARWGR